LPFSGKLAAVKARRVVLCRICERETPQSYVGSERGTEPDRDTEFYRCTVCETVYITLADVTDAESLIAKIANDFLASSTDYGDVRSLEREEVLGETQKLLWEAYLEWDPTRCARFRAYAIGRVPLRLVSWVRRERGFERRRGGKVGGGKAHATAVSLDAPARADSDGDGASTLGLRLGEALGSRSGDLATHGSPSLARALARRDRGVDREVAALGLGPPA